RRVRGSRAGLGVMRASHANSTFLDPAISTGLSVRPQRKVKVTFRVIARKAGEHAFRRVDMQRAVELAILDRFPAWRLVEDGGRLEVWAQLVKDLLVVGIRLSDNELRQRSYRVASLPAALKPTVARGLVLLSRPQPDDIFL